MDASHRSGSSPAPTSNQAVRASVQDAFAERARQTWRIAELLYTPEDLATLPKGVLDTALGLGNPVREAKLQPGERVLDIGCGTGIDTILAAQRVGSTGSVIGLDITPGMIE